MSQAIIADCLPHFHHPSGDFAACVPNIAPVPSVSMWGLVVLMFLVGLIGAIAASAIASRYSKVDEFDERLDR